MRYTLAAGILCLFGSAADANVGYFSGSGHTLRLEHTADVQLVSEYVTIRPIPGDRAPAKAFPETDRVQYLCTFVLKNLSARPLTAQVGFPLNAGDLCPPLRELGGQLKQHMAKLHATERDPQELVRDYRFIARDSAQTYPLRFQAALSDKSLSCLFLWDMRFGPNETRKLSVSYEIKVSESLASTDKACGGEAFATGRVFREEGGGMDVLQSRANHPKALYYVFDGCGIEWFEYVTETGRSWAGNIERATFRVNVREFEKRLPQSRTAQGLIQLFTDDGMGPPPPWTTGGLYFHRTVFPGGWTERDGIITWEYKNYHPGALMVIGYWVTPQPAQALDWPNWAHSLRDRADLLDLREIVKAMGGIPPTREPVKTYVKNQVWYFPRPDRKESDLDAETKAKLAVVDQLLHNSVPPVPALMTKKRAP